MSASRFKHVNCSAGDVRSGPPGGVESLPPRPSTSAGCRRRTRVAASRDGYSSCFLTGSRCLAANTSYRFGSGGVCARWPPEASHETPRESAARTRSERRASLAVTITSLGCWGGARLPSLRGGELIVRGRSKNRTRRGSLPTSSGSFSRASSWRMAARSPTTTFRRSPLCTSCCACAVRACHPSHVNEMYGVSFPTSAAERRHPTGRECVGSSTPKTLNEPILRWLCLGLRGCEHTRQPLRSMPLQ
jgi:hypothetical protein